jgi:hypothetical protein
VLSRLSWFLVLCTLAGCAPGGTESLTSELVEDDEDAVYAASKLLWQVKSVPVCWENASDANAEGRAWVQDAVAMTWETHGPIDFVGWQPCAGYEGGIRITVEDAGPHVKALGRALADKPKGMVLNFTFDSWSPSCKNALDYCIRTIAVHEFRPRARLRSRAEPRRHAPRPRPLQRRPAGLRRRPVSWAPGTRDSVMNYCNPEWNGAGELSDKDIAALELLYGDVGLTGMIVNVASDKCLDVEAASLAAGAALLSYSCHGDANQRFEAADAGSGFRVFFAKHSGLCLTAEGTADGSRIVQRPCEGLASQQFRPTPQSDGSARLVGKESGRCVDLPGGDAGDAVALQLWSCHGGENQRFFLK